MELNNENMKKIRHLIVFTALIILCFWKYTIVFQAVKFVIGVVFPFILGGAIAFVFNVPMHFIENRLIQEKWKEKYKIVRKTARPVSLVLTIIFVIGIVAAVLFGVLPQLTGTIAKLGYSIQTFIPKVQEWANDWFHNNKEVMAYVNQLEFNWDRVIEVAVDWVSNGAGNIVESGVTAAVNIVSGFATFFIAFVFACYILLLKEKLGVQAKKVLFAFVQKKLTGSWLEDIHDTNEKQIDKDWKNFRKERNVGKEIMQSVFATLICSGPVIIFGLWQSSKIFIIGGIVLAIVIFFVPTGNGNAAKKRLIKECEKEFPGWIRGIALDLQTDNVYMSLRNSAPNAPYVFRNEIYKLLDEIEKDPTGILPYQHFLEDLEVPDIHSIVKMLYSLNEVGSDDAETQINSLIVRNNALIEKAERLKDADKVKLVKQITWLPMLISTAKIFLDMGLLIMFLFQMMGKLQ